MNTIGYVWILSAATLWGIIGPVSKAAFQEGLAPMEVAFWRATLAWIFFAAHAALTRQVRIETRDVLPIGVFAFTGVALFYGSYQLAIQAGGAAMASVLLYTAPVWVAVMSRLIFREQFSIFKIAAVAMTTIGVAAVSIGGSSQGIGGASLNPAAIGFGLCAGFCYSMYYIFGKYFSNRYTSPNLFLYMLPFGAICLFPFVSFSHKTPTAWAALITMAAFSTYGAYYCYYCGLKYLEASRAAVSATLEPVVAAVVAYLWWGETFRFGGYIGSVLILSSVLLIIWDGAQRAREPR